MQRVEFRGFGGIALVGDAFGEADDPAVLLLPPSGQTREFWHGSAKALADAGRYAICIDPRGYGDSAHAADGRYDLDVRIADLRAILASLPNRAFVVGAGLGGIIALTAVGESAPHLVSGLALVDVSIWFEEAVLERLHTALLHRTTGAAGAADILQAMALAHPGEPQAGIPDRLLSAFEKGDDGDLAWRGDPRALGGSDLLDQQARLGIAASRISAPVTLIRGALNATITGDTVRRLQAMIPGAELAEIAGAGHFLGADREDAFNSVLLDFLERLAPRRPLTYVGGSEPRVLRDALGCFATGVTIITTLDDAGNPIGLTANSFTSVSMDPPLILFSLARSSANLPIFVAAGRFAVNVLHIGQQPLANRFIQRDIDRFAEVDWSIRAEHGSPILAGALSSFDCTTHAVHEGGDHIILIGRVINAWYEPHRDSLLYFRGKYRRLHFN